jgi:hypothetical protein
MVLVSWLIHNSAQSCCKFEHVKPVATSTVEFHGGCPEQRRNQRQIKICCIKSFLPLLQVVGPYFE